MKNTHEEHRSGVTRKWVPFSSLKHPHIIQYSPGLFSNDEAIERAEERLNWKEKCHHPLYNNSHHFVTLAKTGKENPLTEITKGLLYEGMHIISDYCEFCKIGEQRSAWVAYVPHQDWSYIKTS